MILSRIISKIKRQKENYKSFEYQKFLKCAKNCYQSNPLFYQEFIKMIVTQKDIQWMLCVSKSMSSKQYYQVMFSNQKQGQLLRVLINAWIKYYLHQRIKQPYNEQTFSQQFQQFCQVITYLMLITSNLYTDHSMEYLFDLVRIYVTNFQQFKQIYQWFIHQCQKKKIIHFTESQIKLNEKQLQSLIMIRKIPAPFDKTISLIKLFCNQFKVAKKVTLACQILESIQKEIDQYRIFHKLGPQIIGMDQILPSLSVALQRAMTNICSSCQFIKAVYGVSYSQQYYQNKVNQINFKAYHSLEMLDIAASVNSHSSQIFN